MKLARLALLGLLCALVPHASASASSSSPTVRLAAAADSIPLPSIPYIDDVFTAPAQPNDVMPTTLLLDGKYPWACGVVEPRLVSQNLLVLTMRRTEVCPTVVNWRLPVILGVLPAGTHTMEIRLRVIGEDQTLPADSTVYSATISFPVVSVNPPPPPPGIGLPYVDQILIGPANDRTRPICPGDSIRVQVLGTFPNTCYILKRIELIPSDITVIGPPTMRIVVDNQECLGMPCAEVLTGWSGGATLPPLPVGSYDMKVELLEVNCTDETPPDTIPATHVAFLVADCQPPSDCLLGAFVHPVMRGRCDATLGPDGSADLLYAVHSGVALAGLQGHFGVQPPGLKITKLEAVGAAADMHLTWSEEPGGGASFVLVSQNNAVIPPSTDPVPILHVALSRTDAQQPIPPITAVMADAFGSDVEGNAVPHCPTFAPVSATVCILSACDHNHDGRIDVRDLVLMVRCLRGVGACPDDAVLDCNGDGSFTFDDVICCAWRILRRADCPECPRDTTQARHEPGVRYSVGEPLRLPNTVRTPISIEGAGLLGGVRLELGFPADRYTVESVEMASRPNWMDLYDVEGGKIVLGLIRTSTDIEAHPEPIEVMVTLARKPGQSEGGSLTTLASEFSGPDGAALDVEVDRSTQPLSVPLTLSLSANRPDPFKGETRFSLTLTKASDVNIAIYDVGGRLVRSLYRGEMTAGSHELTWDGMRSDGVHARRGIYFYRAIAEDQSVARKMILLGTD